MGAARGLVINGKFLAGQKTGVYRVGDRLTREMGRHRKELAELFGEAPAIWAPRTARGGDCYGLPIRQASLLTGQSWEQVELPARLGKRLLLSFCNLAPVAHANAVTMIHDAQTFLSPASYSPAFRTFYRTLQPILGQRHRCILTVSHYSAAQLVAHGIASAEKIRVVHNGVDHMAEVTADGKVLARLGLSTHGYVLALASTQAHKNLRVLLRAFATPPAGVSLVLFGACDRRTMEQEGLHVPKGVVFAGRVSDGEIRALMESALCFAMPSLTEGFGLPPLEAMQLGCPAIIAPCGALPEVCGDAAMTANPHDPRAWGEAVQMLAEDAVRRTTQVTAGRAQASLFTWKAAGDSVIAAIREVQSSVHSPLKRTSIRYSS